MKSFFKQVTIYGVLPVAGKFIGFFLVPIYARVFSSSEFGIVELLVTLAHFLMFACNLEFYTAIGRFFYDSNSIDERKKLISTGLFLTLFFTITVVIAAIFAEGIIIDKYIKSNDYLLAYRLSIIWLFLSSLYTYLSVIPRYDKKPKLYVAINIASLLIRVGSTIAYVLYFKWGVTGVIAGHITGSVVSLILNAVVSWKYIGLHFIWPYAKKIAKFAIPIVPGLLIIGFWNPLSRSLIANHYSMETVGHLGFALRITSLLMIINSAVKLAWNPMLFEEYNKPTFKKNLKQISDSVGIIVYWGIISLTLLSPEIVKYIGTAEYSHSVILIGFLSLQGGLEILRRLRGFGPLLNNKTYILTFNEIVGILVGVGLIIALKPLGIIGIGLAFSAPSIIKYILLISYTKRVVYINYHTLKEIVFIITLIVSILLVMYCNLFVLRILIIAFITYFTLPELKQVIKK